LNRKEPWRLENKGMIQTREKDTYEEIKTYRLHKPEVKAEFQNEIDTEIELIKERFDEINVEETCQAIMNILMTDIQRAFGVAQIDKRKKQTLWWSPAAKEQVKATIQKWKYYLMVKSVYAYEEYKRERLKTEELVTKAKQKEWIDFGEKI
ncbi:hypothetical protein HHI36_013360, partial [Cryptolaemus montrouzieri]